MKSKRNKFFFEIFMLFLLLRHNLYFYEDTHRAMILMPKYGPIKSMRVSVNRNVKAICMR
jgi:hypothetical protein